MKQGLHLKLGQQLTMTPQLQQAIRLLQLSTIDLQQEIQQALQDNPLLEVDEEQRSAEHEGSAAPNVREGLLDHPENGASAAASTADGDFDTAMPDELPVDTQWEDILPSSAPPPADAGAEDYDFEGRNGAS